MATMFEEGGKALVVGQLKQDRTLFLRFPLYICLIRTFCCLEFDIMMKMFFILFHISIEH